MNRLSTKRCNCFSLLLSIPATVLLLMSGCNETRSHVDLSEIQIEVPFFRFDQELAKINEDSMAYQISRLEQNHGPFLELFNQKIIRIGSTHSRSYPEELNYFLQDPVMREALEVTLRDFREMEDIQSDIFKGFQHFHYNFPDKPIPAVYFFFGGFNQSVVVAETFLGIGLDKYLGAESPFYQALQVPGYMRKKMEASRIPFDCLYGWVSSEFPMKGDNHLLAQMIQHGKWIFAMQCLFPEAPLSSLFPYSEAEWKWLEESEKEMWSFLIEKQLLFSSDYKTTMRFINDGPFTQPFSDQSPARAGIWIGWRLVSSYMKNSPDENLSSLMARTDDQALLSLSKYNP